MTSLHTTSVVDGRVGRLHVHRAPDQHGHGRSEGERVLLRGAGVLVADAGRVLAEVRRQRPGTPIVVVGHSLGAHVALLLGSPTPVRSAP